MSSEKKYRGIHTAQEFRNKKTIIVGEVNTGKTAYLAEILTRFLEEGETNLTVIDMAPENVKGIGGKMRTGGTSSLRYYTVQIVAPRLVGRTVDEVEILARENVRLIDGLFKEYLKNPSKVLFINDISLYLQAGDLDKLLSFLSATPTVIMNGYYGSILGGGKLGSREPQKIKALQKRCDRVIKV